VKKIKRINLKPKIRQRNIIQLTDTNISKQRKNILGLRVHYWQSKFLTLNFFFNIMSTFVAVQFVGAEISKKIWSILLIRPSKYSNIN